MAARFINQVDVAEANGASSSPTLSFPWAQVEVGIWADPLMWGWDAKSGFRAMQG